MLASIPAELKLVIAGNHDITLDEAFCRGPYAKKRGVGMEDHCEAKAFWGEKGEARRAGVRYLEEGVHAFTLRSRARFTVSSGPTTLIC